MLWMLHHGTWSYFTEDVIDWDLLFPRPWWRIHGPCNNQWNSPHVFNSRHTPVTCDAYCMLTPPHTLRTYLLPWYPSSVSGHCPTPANGPNWTGYHILSQFLAWRSGCSASGQEASPGETSWIKNARSVPRRRWNWEKVLEGGTRSGAATRTRSLVSGWVMVIRDWMTVTVTGDGGERFMTECYCSFMIVIFMDDLSWTWVILYFLPKYSFCAGTKHFSYYTWNI